jgi:pimeloyl-ACP methyl ester carboxylesterase
MSTTDITLTETGTGRPALVLHGGGGPATVAMIADHLSGSMRALLPTNPGWNGVPRPAAIESIPDIAGLYLDLLGERELTDVLIVGSSLGGSIGAEMAVRDRGERISELVLIDAVGIDVPGEPMTDFFALDARGVAEHSFHDSERFYVDPATIPPEQAATMQATIATMRAVAGDPYMHDPELQPKLAAVTVPTLMLWGDSDRIATPAYGEAYAHSFGNASFEVVEDAGHLPQIEQPAATFAAIDAFVEESRMG